MNLLHKKRVDFRKIEDMITSLEIPKDDVIILLVLLEYGEYDNLSGRNIMPEKYIWKP